MGLVEGIRAINQKLRLNHFPTILDMSRRSFSLRRNEMRYFYMVIMIMLVSACSIPNLDFMNQHAIPSSIIKMKNGSIQFDDHPADQVAKIYTIEWELHGKNRKRTSCFLEFTSKIDDLSCDRDQNSIKRTNLSEKWYAQISNYNAQLLHSLIMQTDNKEYNISSKKKS
jgi:hypothetical protein